MSYRYLNEYREKTMSFISSLLNNGINNTINNTNNTKKSYNNRKKLNSDIYSSAYTNNISNIRKYGVDNVLDRLRIENLNISLDDLYYGYYSYEQIKNNGEYFIYKDINGDNVIVSSVTKKNNVDELQQNLKDIKYVGIVKEFIERKQYKFTSYLEYLNKQKFIVE